MKRNVFEKDLGQRKNKFRFNFFKPLYSEGNRLSAQNVSEIFSTMVDPMLREAVAAGEGALQRLMMREFSSMRKSSTNPPSGETA